MASSSKNVDANKAPQTDSKSLTKLEDLEEKQYIVPQVPKLKLNNDQEIPILGLGTSKVG